MFCQAVVSTELWLSKGFLTPEGLTEIKLPITGTWNKNPDAQQAKTHLLLVRHRLHLALACG